MRISVTKPPTNATVKTTHALLERAVTAAGLLTVRTGRISTEPALRVFIDAQFADIERAVRGDDVPESTARMVACAMETAGAKGVRLI